jgi:hypothetical protein
LEQGKQTDYETKQNNQKRQTNTQAKQKQTNKENKQIKALIFLVGEKYLCPG